MNAILKARFAKAREMADKAAEKWLRTMEDRLEERVADTLDARLVEIVSKLLGFDNNWGQWEIDHCNGRAGESAAGDWVRERAGKAVKEWLDAQAGKLPGLSEKQKSALRSDYKKRLYEDVERRLARHAEADAQDLLAKIMEEFAQELGK